MISRSRASALVGPTAGPTETHENSPLPARSAHQFLDTAGPAARFPSMRPWRSAGPDPRSGEESRIPAVSAHQFALEGWLGIVIELAVGARHPSTGIYSIRRPEIARAITSCWISLVPSKIVWFTFSDFLVSSRVVECG
jgi:hypothetical protein